MTRVKWETMTDESQAMVKQVGLISIGGVIFLDFSKMIVPLVFLDIVHFFYWLACLVNVNYRKSERNQERFKGA